MAHVQAERASPRGISGAPLACIQEEEREPEHGQRREIPLRDDRCRHWFKPSCPLHCNASLAEPRRA